MNFHENKSLSHFFVSLFFFYYYYPGLLKFVFSLSTTVIRRVGSRSQSNSDIYRILSWCCGYARRNSTLSVIFCILRKLLKRRARSQPTADTRLSTSQSLLLLNMSTNAGITHIGRTRVIEEILGLTSHSYSDIGLSLRLYTDVFNLRRDFRVHL